MTLEASVVSESVSKATSDVAGIKSVWAGWFWQLWVALAFELGQMALESYPFSSQGIGYLSILLCECNRPLVFETAV